MLPLVWVLNSYLLWACAHLLILHQLLHMAQQASLTKAESSTICNYKHQYWEGILSTCLFSKTTVSKFSPKSWNPSNHVFLTRHTILGMSSLLWSRPHVQAKSVWLHPYTSHDTITLVGPFCLAGWYWTTQSPQLIKTVDGFSVLATWPASPCTVSTKQLESTF